MHRRKSETWLPRSIFDRPDQIAIAPAGSDAFEYRTGDLHFACCLERKAEASHLCITIQSAIDRARAKPPVFLTRDWIARCNVHVLSVSDPTLFLSDTLNVSLFLGSREQDATSRLVELGMAVAGLLRVDPRDIVYVGHSAAGFSAAMAATRTMGRALLINPLLDLGRFSRSSWTAEVLRIFGCTDFPTVEREAPQRVSVPAALRAARAKGQSPRLTILQNKDDGLFWRTQYLPFCAEFYLPEEGGVDVSGHLRTRIFSDPSGHISQPGEIIETCLRDLIDAGPADPLFPHVAWATEEA